ncbi:MAG: choline dehydrogenase [Candidatus Rokuibacteriota bacterium]|nr:MAG: choline dehydrogenase [Candidatus Rokubacteria bacterium]
MPRIGSPLERMRPHYTVVVVGSGYGGAIAASRLARAGQSVCLLERGQELRPGEFPDTAGEAVRETQLDLPTGHVGSRTSLYDIRVNDDINVFMGCGLGGTSLVNANVALRPDPRVYDDARWPRALRADVPTRLAEGFRRAEEMLKPNPYPADQPPLAKLSALERSGSAVGQPATRVPINVTFADGVNHVGVEQHACTLCGDCMSGCNAGAKNTLLMNYLPDARNHGAEIYTELRVRRVERVQGRWLVHFEPLGLGRERFGAPSLFVSADVVILAAGSLGTSEILLRSRAAGLPMSDRVGEGFTGNGDVVAFGYNTDEVVNAIGFGHRAPGDREPVGPCITGVIDLRGTPRLADGMILEEGSVSGALAGLLPATLAAAAQLGVAAPDEGSASGRTLAERARELDSVVRGPHHGAVQHTQVYLVMAHDDGQGRMYLEDDRLRIAWPEVGAQPVFARIDQRLIEATRPLGGTLVRNPLWTDLLRHRLITVHPLGGSIMAEDAEAGVVNDRGQVFAGSSGTAVHEGLYACDGAIVPGPLGVNPLLTISALAERTVALLAEERGWSIDYTLPSAASVVPEALRVGLRFTETMRGHLSTRVTDDFTAAAARGEADGSPLEFTLTVISRDLDRMLSDPAHRAALFGTVTAPAVSPDPLTVADGTFSLFVVDATEVGARQMRYEATLVARTGERYRFEGFKRIHDDPGLDLWADTTTLYVTVRAAEPPDGRVVGRGILRIAPADFSRQMTSMQVLDAVSVGERLRALARFGQFFAGALHDVYGGVVARASVFDPAAPPRKRRPLRAGAPEAHAFATDDGVRLRLTRLEGGRRGPVILAHDLGVSSLIFRLDTIETSLAEYLASHGFDVWLLDYRASIDLPASATPFTADDVARYDYPAAVDAVRERTGARTVQVVAQGMGAATFVMAMLGGLPGVRAVVCSQAAAHLAVPTMTRIKTGLHLPEFLEAVGIESLTAYVDRQANWKEQLFDRALALFPVDRGEGCASSVCHRITLMYGSVYEHKQLNAATHDALHELFGLAGIRMFEHVGRMIRAGHLVSADGADRYLPHINRLAIPIAFIHGAENGCFRPESTERTYELLRSENGPELYRRHVIPGYGHVDCILGKNAVGDVYPLMAEHLDATA